MSESLNKTSIKKRYEPIMPVKITGGILQDRCQKNIKNFFMKEDINDLKKVYAEEHDSTCATPAYTNIYIDAAIQLYLNNESKEIFNGVKELVLSIIDNQRKDGYLGTYYPGLEFNDTFSVMNHSQTIMGLLSYYEVTEESKALDAAMKGGSYVASNYLKKDGPDLLNTTNQGIENSLILLPMAKLYRVTGKKLYKDFCDFIIRKWESTTLKFISRPKVFHLGCVKTPETVMAYQGLIEYGIHQGRKNYIDAAAEYWEDLNDHQIGLTGNGGIVEFWNYLGNEPALLNNDCRPNENCAAVVWMRFCADLFSLNAEVKYMDAFEKTLFNHLLGSQAIDGSSFSYYQGNYGQKIHNIRPEWYQSCRYRGMNMLINLPKYIYWRSSQGFTVVLYCSSEMHSEYKGVKVRFLQETTYPREGKVLINVQPESDIKFTLKLRLPSWCINPYATINGDVLPIENNHGYICIEKIWKASGDVIELSLDMPVRCIDGFVDENGDENIAVTYGPSLLAIDSRYGTPIDSTKIRLKDDCVELKSIKDDDSSYTPLVKFTSPGQINGKLKEITLVDYASAGSIDNIKDRFRTWLPVLG